MSEAAQGRITELERALKHAQEAIFWYGAEGFEIDGRRVGEVVDAALSHPSHHQQGE